MKKFIITIVALLILIGGAYSAGIGYYAEKFQANTTFGNIDISNKTFAEAQEIIEQDINKKEITLTENGQEIGRILLGDLEPQLKTEEVLTQTYNNQNPNEWVAGYFSSQHYDNALLDNVSFDAVKINQELNDLGIDNMERTPAIDASINYTDVQGYYVTEAEKGNQLDSEKIQDLIIEGIQEGQETIEINQAYMDPVVTEEDESITSLMDQIDAASNISIELNIAGNSVVIPKEEIQKWIYFDSSNQIIYDQNMIYEYLGTLNEAYATYNKVREFQSTSEGVVSVEPGTLGWSIDRDSETQNIVADLEAGVDVSREPTIVGTGYNSTDGNDIGSSYIEVSMDLQHMWVYKDGVVVVDTPIVTGQIGTDTIPGAYSIWGKEEDSALRGYNPRTQADYEQPVDYWIPFDDTGQGIHDANWQSSFGGDTYLVSGSLGCINTPPDIMPSVFAHAELGMPVIIH